MIGAARFPALGPTILVLSQAIALSHALAGVAGQPNASPASTFYVDPDFSGRTEGSAARPWTQLQIIETFGSDTYEILLSKTCALFGWHGEGDIDDK